MASVINAACKSGLINRMILRSQMPNFRRWATSTTDSEKKGEVVEGNIKYENIPDFTKPLDRKNWVSYGFDHEDPESDKYQMHSLFFLTTFAVASYIFFFGYGPDHGERNWARREAYIRLHERQKLGLDPIDKNYVDPEKMVLPSDEELGDMEIVI